VTLYSWLAALDIAGVEHFVTLFLGKRQNQYEQKLIQFDEKEKLYKDLIARLSALTEEYVFYLLYIVTAYILTQNIAQRIQCRIWKRQHS